jgi:hypothetical protein
MKLLKLLFLLLSPTLVFALDSSFECIKSDTNFKISETNDTVNSNDSTIRKYLVVRSHRWYRRSYIFKNNKRLKVTTLSGGVMRGRLKIIDDSSFILYNTMNSKLDTFRISEIYKINNVSLGGNIAAAIAFVGGTALIAGGYDTYNNNQSRLGYSILGIFIMMNGVGLTVASIPLVNGKPLPDYKYAFVIIETKGKKLRYWDLRKIFPR